jgi:hypothetical protein
MPRRITRWSTDPPTPRPKRNKSKREVPRVNDPMLQAAWEVVTEFIEPLDDRIQIEEHQLHRKPGTARDYFGRGDRDR